MKVTVNVTYNLYWEEYIVSLFEGREVVSTYHTNDKSDANQTAVLMLAEGVK
jgi:hypothetical protein